MHRNDKTDVKDESKQIGIMLLIIIVHKTVYFSNFDKLKIKRETSVKNRAYYSISWLSILVFQHINL